jgi:hypothetical protein
MLTMASVKHLLAITALLSAVASDGLPVSPFNDDGVSISYNYTATFTETDWVYVTSTACPCPTGLITTTSTIPLAMPTSMMSTGSQLIPSDTIIATSNPIGASSTTSGGSSPTSSTASDTAQTEYVDAVLLHHAVHRANHSDQALTWSQDMANIAEEIAQTCIYKHVTYVEQ